MSLRRKVIEDLLVQTGMSAFVSYEDLERAIDARVDADLKDSQSFSRTLSGNKLERVKTRIVHAFWFVVSETLKREKAPPRTDKTNEEMAGWIVRGCPADPEPLFEPSTETRVPTDGDGLIVCPKCRSRHTSYTQLQTRSGDEGFTVFCSCEKCGFRWTEH